jgi:hypothetical protein
MSRAERLLSWLLRILAVPVLLAIPCALLPVAWMDATHQWLGLGALPEAPILEYLARSASLLYGFHGFLLLLVASDVRRYLPVIWLMGGAGFAFGLAMIVIDHAAGLPVYWRWLEGGFIVAESSLILILARRVTLAIRATSATHAGHPA